MSVFLLERHVIFFSPDLRKVCPRPERHASPAMPFLLCDVPSWLRTLERADDPSGLAALGGLGEFTLARSSSDSVEPRAGVANETLDGEGDKRASWR